MAEKEFHALVIRLDELIVAQNRTNQLLEWLGTTKAAPPPGGDGAAFRATTPEEPTG